MRRFLGLDIRAEEKLIRAILGLRIGQRLSVNGKDYKTLKNTLREISRDSLTEREKKVIKCQFGLHRKSRDLNRRSREKSGQSELTVRRILRKLSAVLSSEMEKTEHSSSRAPTDKEALFF